MLAELSAGENPKKLIFLLLSSYLIAFHTNKMIVFLSLCCSFIYQVYKMVSNPRDHHMQPTGDGTGVSKDKDEGGRLVCLLLLHLCRLQHPAAVLLLCLPSGGKLYLCIQR